MRVKVGLLFLGGLFWLSGCYSDEPKESNFIEYSRSVEKLALFVNLDGLDIESVYWTSGPVIRENDSFLPSSNDWWLNAVINIYSEQKVEEITQGCKFLYSINDGEIDSDFVDDTIRKLTSNPNFFSAPIEVFDACRFRSSALPDGVLVKDVNSNQVLVRLFVN
ncbi:MULTISPECIES: hypothetical protein [unclassified Agarivorans]|uniref:hypothetical protein n=1 Tax=unclassified Agarivorans TaxID=2636026 RepID=UPI0026E38234|nr:MULTISPECIES: hypothetical protein [unclassified Agarivorans]MDO6685272.1 hypothetical protein [Agarivorans sp. 3_MG-2023]MDO6715556.1 hypothetical protein [Agarivorans sp. 2_MG-2023]